MVKVDILHNRILKTTNIGVNNYLMRLMSSNSLFYYNYKQLFNYFILK